MALGSFPYASKVFLVDPVIPPGLVSVANSAILPASAAISLITVATTDAVIFACICLGAVFTIACTIFLCSDGSTLKGYPSPSISFVLFANLASDCFSFLVADIIRLSRTFSASSEVLVDSSKASLSHCLIAESISACASLKAFVPPFAAAPPVSLKAAFIFCLASCIFFVTSPSSFCS